MCISSKCAEREALFKGDFFSKIINLQVKLIFVEKCMLISLFFFAHVLNVKIQLNWC